MKHLLLITIFTLYSFGCGWVNGTTIHGHWIERQGERSIYDGMDPDGLKYSLESTSEAIDEYLREKFSEQEKESNTTKAVFSMLRGEHKKAIIYLLEEEKKGANRYEVAANLGTAYELSGDNAKALKWIKEGIKRNPDSHHGTEWLHVRILETKLKMQNDADYLINNHILSNEELLSGGYSIIRALLYQLKERMLFVKPQDPIVADLLYTYAIAIADNGGFLEYAREALELSEKYGYANPQELTDTKEKFQDIIDRVALIQYLKLAAWVLLFFVLVFIAYKKKWLFLTRKSRQIHVDKSVQEKKLNAEDKDDKDQQDLNKEGVEGKTTKQNIKLKVGRVLLLLGVILLITSPIFGSVSFVFGVGLLLFGYMFYRDGKNERDNG